MAKNGKELFFWIHDNALSNIWMIKQLSRRGICTSAAEFSNVLNGSRTGPKAAAILETANAIAADYDKEWA